MMYFWQTRFGHISWISTLNWTWCLQHFFSVINWLRYRLLRLELLWADKGYFYTKGQVNKHIYVYRQQDAIQFFFQKLSIKGFTTFFVSGKRYQNIYTTFILPELQQSLTHNFYRRLGTSLYTVSRVHNLKYLLFEFHALYDQ